jgi:hypothetical protein
MRLTKLLLLLAPLAVTSVAAADAELVGIAYSPTAVNVAGIAVKVYLRRDDTNSSDKADDKGTDEEDSAACTTGNGSGQSAFAGSSNGSGPSICSAGSNRPSSASTPAKGNGPSSGSGRATSASVTGSRSGGSNTAACPYPTRPISRCSLNSEENDEKSEGNDQKSSEGNEKSSDNSDISR